ncbi:MAG: CheR family methyltransferase [Planctomycetota bacterium]
MNLPPDTLPSLPSQDDLELRLLLEAVFQHYGYDFRNYASSSLKRRMRKCLFDEGFETFSAFQERLLCDTDCFKRLLLTISVNVTSLFRDPTFYRNLRAQIIPFLRTYPSLRIWIAGCATGEEAYSLAIILKEEGLYDQSRIYATDINEASLRKAKDGLFPLSVMQSYTANYQLSGGTRAFSSWYTTDSDNAMLRAELKKNIVFAIHNLATDGVFNEFHLYCTRLKFRLFVERENRKKQRSATRFF